MKHINLELPEAGREKSLPAAVWLAGPAAAHKKVVAAHKEWAGTGWQQQESWFLRGHGSK